MKIIYKKFLFSILKSNRFKDFVEKKTIVQISILSIIFISSNSFSQSNIRSDRIVSAVSYDNEPTPNKIPEKWLTIVGEKPLNLTVWIGLRSIARESSCKEKTLFTALAGTNGHAPEIIDGVFLEQGVEKFQLRIALDRYMHGKCDWTPSGLVTTVFDSTVEQRPMARTGLMHFDPSGVKDANLYYKCARSSPSGNSGNVSQIFCTQYRGGSSSVSVDGANLGLYFEVEKALSGN